MTILTESFGKMCVPSFYILVYSCGSITPCRKGCLEGQLCKGGPPSDAVYGLMRGRRHGANTAAKHATALPFPATEQTIQPRSNMQGKN